MKTAASPIRFAGSQLGESRHVCAFFHNADEEYRVMLPFIKDGFECGDKAVHIVSPMIIIGGSLQQNPFFVPPEEFLSDFRERRAARIAAMAV